MSSVGGVHRSCRVVKMHKRQRQRHAWTIEWKQVSQSDREERLQRALALIVPQTEIKARHQARG
jgi:hypothetical protein